MKSQPESEKTEAVKCDFCGKEIECPGYMMDAEKHACFGFFKDPAKANSLPGSGKVHIDIPFDKKTEFSDIMAELITSQAFPGFWSYMKSEIKGLSKKEIAEEMFKSGIQAAFDFIDESLKNIEEPKPGKPGSRHGERDVEEAG